MKNKLINFIKKYKMSIFIMVSVIIMLIGLSYAWLQLSLHGEKELILSAGTLKLNLDDSISDGITMVDVIPISDEEGIASNGYTFTLENTGTIDSKYEIFLDDLDILETDTRMNSSFIKYQLTKEKEIIGYDLLSSIGEHPNRILDSGNIAPGEKYSYTLKIWIASTATNEVMGTVFKGQLRVDAMQGENNRLYKKIAKQATLDDQKSEFVNDSTGIDFKRPPSDTNGKGVYTLASTKKDKFPVYYYRGAITNNNLKFAGFCWKIIRTTSTGGTKIIYNGQIDENGMCSNTKGGTGVTIKHNSFNQKYNSPADVGYMYGNREDYIVQLKNIAEINENWIYGNDVEWDGQKYTLKDTITSNTADWAADSETIETKYHYTCFSTENSCTEIGYIHVFDNSTTIRYLTLKGGKNIEDAKKEMFTNTTDSAIKKLIDEWYQSNLVEYTEKLEDSIWCNDRSISEGSLKSKDEDSTISRDTNGYSQTIFGANTRNQKNYKPSIVCPNENDKFTVSKKNGNGALTYPVALLTADEMTLIGQGFGFSNSQSYLTTYRAWTLSPSTFSTEATNYFLQYSGYMDKSRVNNTYEIYPVISLAFDTIIISGDGTNENPYTLKNK